MTLDDVTIAWVVTVVVEAVVVRGCKAILPPEKVELGFQSSWRLWLSYPGTEIVIAYIL